MGKAVVLDSGMTQPSHVKDRHTDGKVEEKRTDGIPAPGTQMTGAQAVIKTLEALGVTDVFGLPGGAILPTYDPLLASRKINHILVRHEQGAGHAAQGYAQATGRIGVCIATSGPGATNLVTPLADAHMDSVPIVAVTGQVASQTIGRDAFQEADIVGITLPITKHSYLVTSAEGIPQTIAEAFYLARTGRPGPVLVDITKDAQQKTMTWSWPPTMDIEGYHPEVHERSAEVYRGQIHEAAKLIAKARRPVLYVGGGVIKADAAAQLFNFADSTHIPVVTTLTALGAFPDSHPRHLGMPGMHGSVAAVTALQKSDLLIALGTRFDDRVTGVLDGFAPEAQVVHVDIDPAEINKNRHADIAIIGSVKNVIPALQREYEKVHIPTSEQRLKQWWTFLEGIRHDYPLGYPEPLDGLLAPQRVIERIGALSGPESIVVSGVGQHQMWSAQFIRHEHPRHWINSGGLGTMGYAVPAAMGAKIGAAGQTVWAIDGDGCFQMTNQELATCVINNIAIKVAIINNSSLGMVRQWQTLFYDGRYSNTELNTGHNSVRVPDFVKLADAYGAVGLRCEDEATLDETIGKALEINDQPVVVDFVVSKDSMVWPMVPSGVSNDKIQIARDLTPRWERDEK